MTIVLLTQLLLLTDGPVLLLCGYCVLCDQLLTKLLVIVKTVIID